MKELISAPFKAAVFIGLSSLAVQVGVWISDTINKIYFVCLLKSAKTNLQTCFTSVFFQTAVKTSISQTAD